MTQEAVPVVTTTTTTTEEVSQPTFLPTPLLLPTPDPMMSILQGEVTSLREQIATLQTQLQSEANQELQSKLEALQSQMQEMNDRLSSMQIASTPEPAAEVEAEIIAVPNVEDTPSLATEETEEANASGAGIGEALRNLLFGRKKTTR